MTNKKISIIIPTLNESLTIGSVLEHLQTFREKGHEIIVVDGGSADDTITQCETNADMVLMGRRGRALQMNLGAKFASGKILLFLHADTWLPKDADHLIIESLARGKVWGRFDVCLSGTGRLLPYISWCMNFRSRLTGIATGDQAIFVHQPVFESLKGFKVIDLMEDIDLSSRLKRIGPPACLRQLAMTSARRWIRGGVIKTILLMWCLRSAFALGINPTRLNELYNRT